MANAVFNSEDSYFNNNFIKANCPRTPFDLSWINTLDADMGVYIPIYLEETLPNDDFSISLILRATCLPLQNPLYTNIKFRTAFYYVPYYLMWHKFDRFLTGGRDGTMSIPLPKFKGDAVVTPRSLGDYLGFPIGIKYSEVSPFPIFAYQRIYRDFGLNQDNQTSSNVNQWFPLDDFDFSLDNDDYLYLSDRPTDDKIVMDHLRPCNWKRDYFTTAMFSPQRGDPVAMPVQGNATIEHDHLSEDDWNMWQQASSTFGNHGLLLSTAAINDAFAPWPIIKAGNISQPYNETNQRQLESALYDGLKVSFSGAQAGFTIDDLRFATQLQEWLERNMRVKAEYNSFLRVHFNDAPLDERLTRPYFIGGTSQNFSVSEILQTSETTSSSAQGTARGHGQTFDKQFVGKFHSHEYGLILGLLYIMPDTTYSQGLDRHWTKESRYDFYFPEFSEVGPQAILNKELYWTGSKQRDDFAFGYVGRNDEYRHHRNSVSGSLRDPNNADFYAWTMSREFGDVPTLNSMNFTSGLSVNGVVNIPSDKSTIRHDMWLSNKTVNPFIVQCGFEVRAVRPLPYVNIPKGLL